MNAENKKDGYKPRRHYDENYKRHAVDLTMQSDRSVRQVADQLGVSVGQVYLARHRVAAVLKKEVKALEKLEGHAPS